MEMPMYRMGNFAGEYIYISFRKVAANLAANKFAYENEGTSEEYNRTASRGD